MFQGTSVKESDTFGRPYFMETNQKGDLTSFSLDLHSYDGDLPVPYWYADNEGTSPSYS